MSEKMHLTLDERNFIEQELSKNTSFKEIVDIVFIVTRFALILKMAFALG